MKNKIILTSVVDMLEETLSDEIIAQDADDIVEICIILLNKVTEELNAK